MQDIRDEQAGTRIRLFGTRLVSLIIGLAMAAVFVPSMPASAADDPFTTFDAPSFTTRPLGINEAGIITGSNGGAAFVRALDGTITTFTGPGADPEGPGFTQPTGGVNAAGIITGDYLDDAFRRFGFVRAVDGTFTSFVVPNTEQLNVTGSNDAGVITGNYFREEGGLDEGSFVRAADGTIATIDIPGSQLIFARAINHSGVIIGGYDDATGRHGYVRAADGTITTFDLPSALVTPEAVNDAGMITGYHYDDPSRSTGVHGFVRAADGTITTFDVPDADVTEPTSINSFGVITGFYDDATGRHGFVRAPDGTITMFDGPDATRTLPTGINDSGVITGFYDDATGTHGFVRAADATIQNQIAFIAGNAIPPSGDRRLVSHLEANGYDVMVIDDDKLMPGALAEAQIAIVSSSVVPDKVPAWLATAGIALMTTEAHSFEGLGLASKGRETAYTDLTIRINNDNAASPLANGLTFRPQVFSTSPGSINFGRPGDEAIIIGTEATGNRRPIHFAYDAGSALVDGSTAPARRVATFSVYDGQRHLNGTGYGLFDAAVEWLFD